VVIRCNGLETPWGAEDLTAAAEAGPDAILVPKVNGPADLLAYEAAIAHAPAHTRLWAMIETCPAVFALNAIGAVKSSDPASRLDGWAMGLNDLAKEMGCRQTPERTPMLAVLTLAVAAARAHGLFILDGVCNELDDPAGLEAQCRQGVDFGFDGKCLIHPNQIEASNRLFSPPPDEVAWARAVIAAFADPANQGRGALRVEGKLAEFLHLAQSEKLVAIADAIAERTAATT
jgi:citrate lyase subunit beta/citryl-CoA lyase